jgi:uncharacterized protein
MQINVSQLLQEPIGSTREHKFDDAADILGDGKKQRVRGECRLLRIRRGILVKCSLETEVELTCGRCLKRFSHPLKIEFEEEFLPTIDITSGMPLPRGEDTGAFTIDEHHIIDLTEPARQYALLAVPMKPLCRADCAGLCQKCGQDLNQGSCDCPTLEMDPRWSELAKLLGTGRKR